jgi:hypothetical protein
MTTAEKKKRGLNKVNFNNLPFDIKEEKGIIEEGSVYMTYNHDTFVLLDTNRDIAPNHKEKLKKNIQKYGLHPVPILINENFEVIDGQHRLKACQELNLPVYFICGQGLDMSTANQINLVGKTFQVVDAINKQWAHLPDYSRLISLCEKNYSIFYEKKGKKTKPLEYAVPIKIDIRQLSGASLDKGTTIGENINNGYFQFSNFTKTAKIVKEVVEVRNLLNRKRLNKADYDDNVYLQRNFMVALGILYRDIIENGEEYKINWDETKNELHKQEKRNQLYEDLRQSRKPSGIYDAMLDYLNHLWCNEQISLKKSKYKKNN